MGLASRKLGVPVRWTEDRARAPRRELGVERRVTDVEAAFAADGELLALRLRRVEDVGAYVRAPEPATLYRMHGSLTGAYRVQNLAVRNRVVLTNRCPTGLNRGFGGPQLYFALERTMAIAARRLGLDPAELAAATWSRADEFPTARRRARSTTPATTRPASTTCCARGLRRAARGAERGARRRPAPRHRPRLRRRAVGLEHGLHHARPDRPRSAAGCRSRATPRAARSRSRRSAASPCASRRRRRARATHGGRAGRRRRARRRPGDVDVLDRDRHRRRAPWTVSSGNYSSRFSGVGAGAVARGGRAARASKIARDLATHLRRREPPRCAASPASAHWDPGRCPTGMEPGLAVTAFFAVPNLAPPDDDDRVTSSAPTASSPTSPSSRSTARPARSRCSTTRPSTTPGRILNPLLAEGQMRGGLAHGAGAALFERHVYDEDGNLLTATFMDYLAPTAPDLPPPRIGHRETPSPFTAARREGPRRGQHDERARRDRERRRRRPRPRRRRAAADARARLGAPARREARAASRTCGRESLDEARRRARRARRRREGPRRRAEPRARAEHAAARPRVARRPQPRRGPRRVDERRTARSASARSCARRDRATARTIRLLRGASCPTSATS